MRWVAMFGASPAHTYADVKDAKEAAMPLSKRNDRHNELLASYLLPDILGRIQGVFVSN